MKPLATAALVGLALAALAVPARAQVVPEYSRLGLSTASDAFVGPVTVPAAFVPVEIYILIDMQWGSLQNSQGVSAWETRLILPEGEAKWFLTGRDLYPEGQPTDFGDGTNFVVGIGSTLRQLDPATPVTLAKLTLLWNDNSNPVPDDSKFDLTNSTPTSFPAEPKPAWVNATGTEDLLSFTDVTPLGVNCSGSGTTDGPCPVATESLSWGAIKANR